ncbi:MAG: 3-oxoacyl-ACP synthase [Spirochaetaceae bacterium]|jgi:3-oxoacyl-[acyl-carrier-protein] synthase-1|nr:3-oxoacyl-ACP synthase [Spirochaetaceae bacterium]
MPNYKKPLFLSKPGIICVAGNNIKELYNSVTTANQRGIKQITLPNGKQVFAGHIPNTSIYEITNAALEQIRPCVEDAIAEYGKEKIAVCVGSCDNGSKESHIAHKTFFRSSMWPDDYSLYKQSAGNIAQYTATKFGVSGAVFTIATACASSASCFIRAAELITSGLYDAVLTGGADIASVTALLGFDALGALSDKLCNPFSKNRSGTTLGDGAAFFLMSTKDFSGNSIEFLNGGESSDAYHITSPEENGAGAVRAMKTALSGFSADNVDYINLHGTGTYQNDVMEGKAAASVFGTREIPVSSTKPVTGHTLGAAGAIELAICYAILTESSQVFPVHCWDGIYDEAIPYLSFCVKEEKGQKNTHQRKVNICMSNSFAFGGSNVSLLIGRF